MCSLWRLYGSEGFVSLCLVMVLIRSSVVRLKSIGLNGHPCLTPDMIGMEFVVSDVDVLMIVVALVYMSLTRLIRLSWKPMCWRVVYMAW